MSLSAEDMIRAIDWYFMGCNQFAGRIVWTIEAQNKGWVGWVLNFCTLEGKIVTTKITEDFNGCLYWNDVVINSPEELRENLGQLILSRQD